MSKKIDEARKQLNKALKKHAEVVGGTAVSLLTFPKYGIVVAVTSNTSYADTFGLAVNGNRLV